MTIKPASRKLRAEPSDILKWDISNHEYSGGRFKSMFPSIHSRLSVKWALKGGPLREERSGSHLGHQRIR
jgi:hypothetical protein